MRFHFNIGIECDWKIFFIQFQKLPQLERFCMIAKKSLDLYFRLAFVFKSFTMKVSKFSERFQYWTEIFESVIRKKAKPSKMFHSQLCQIFSEYLWLWLAPWISNSTLWTGKYVLWEWPAVSKVKIIALKEIIDYFL